MQTCISLEQQYELFRLVYQDTCMLLNLRTRKLLSICERSSLKIYSNHLLQRCIKLIAAFQMQEKAFIIMEMGIRSQQRNPRKRVLPQYVRQSKSHKDIDNQRRYYRRQVGYDEGGFYNITGGKCW